MVREHLLKVPTVLLKCEKCFEANWMGARRKAASHTRVKHQEIAAVSDNSLACSHEGVKVMFLLFAVFKITEIVLLFGNGLLCPLLVPASAEISVEEESKVGFCARGSKEEPWKLSSRDIPSQENSRVSRGKMKAGSLRRWFRPAAYQVCEGT